MQAHDEITTNTTMTIRRMDLTDRDREAVDRLAEVDSRESLEGPVIGIEIGGSLLAATSLTSGVTIADPFSRTDELRPLLALRAAQLRRRQSRSRSVLRSPRRGRPAVGGGPAGHVIHLPRWG